MRYSNKYFLIFLVASLLALFSEGIFADEISPHMNEENQYRRGLKYRDEGNLEKAIECFKPLAEKKHDKATHNLAMCFYKLGDEVSAYQYFTQGSEQGVAQSTNNLKKMNLLYLLLPNELLSHIISFGNMQMVARFNLVSRRANRVVTSLITSTNFLTSTNPYAIQFRSIFNEVQFVPMPTQLRLVKFAKVDKGSIEVHFRDSEHLKNIVEETPLIQARRTYFVRDKSAKDGAEIVARDGVLVTDYFIHFVATGPLKGTGKINRTLPKHMHLPAKSDFNGVQFEINGGMSTGELSGYTEAQSLATNLETFDEQLFKIRTADAYNLMEVRRKSRAESPDIYPNLSQVCPHACFISTSPIDIQQSDYIDSDQPFIYLAPSITDLTELWQKLPEFGNSIPFIDPECSNSGVYCRYPLMVTKGFEVFCEGDMTVAGNISLYDHNLTIATKAACWNVGSIKVNGSICFKIKKFYNCAARTKPDGMPDEHWRRVLIWYQYLADIQQIPAPF